MLKIDRIIDYSGFRKDSNGVFYLSESDLDKVAENIILQLDATFLFEPRPIPVLDWIEDGVFGNKYDYKDLVVPKAFGLTSFHDDAVFARDSESGLLVPIKVEANTILLNDTLPETQLRFTGGHEVTHFVIHPYYFAEKRMAVAANFGYGKIIPFTPESYWLEWQANYGSASLLMPNRALKIVASDFVQENEILNEQDSNFWPLVHKVAEVFNVSKFAAGIRLRQQKYITNYPDY